MVFAAPWAGRKGPRRVALLVGAVILLLVGATLATLLTSFLAGNTVPPGNVGVTSVPRAPGQFPPTSTITFPSSNPYGNTAWNAGCASAICGAAQDGAGPSNILNVKISILGPSGHYWNGADFNTSATQQLFTATGTSSWSLPFPASNLATAGGGQGTYTVKAYATDLYGDIQAPAATTSFRLDTIPPTNALSLTVQTPTGSSFLSGSTVYYRGTGGGAGGTFEISNAVADSSSAPASSATAALGGVTSGWTQTPSMVSSPAGGPYTSTAFSWTEGSTSSPTEVVTGADTAGNTTAATLTFSNDSTAPTGGALSVNGTAASSAGTTSSSSTTSFAIGARTNYTDAGSGLLSSTLTIQSETYTGGTCGSPGSGGSYTTATVVTGTTNPATASGFCYRYVLTGTDNVGNSTSVQTTVTVNSTLTLTATPAGGSTCTSSVGPNAAIPTNTTSCPGNLWPSVELSSTLANSLATTFATVGTNAPSSTTLTSGSGGTEVASDTSGNGNDAFPLAGATFGASGPLGGNAVSFDGTSGMLETQQAINNPGPNLTLSGWFQVASGYASGGGIIGFQSAQTGAPGSWDRKIWMDNSGHICAGVNNGGVDVGCSTTAYNNGNWHYVAASFSSTSGLTVYVDGTSVATNTAATAGQNYVGYWTLGYGYPNGFSPVPSRAYLGGSLAELAVFPSALSSSAVTTLYGGGSGTEPSFETRVLADSPGEFWPLQRPALTTNLPVISTLPDISGNNDLGLPQSGVTPSDQGPFGSDGAMTFTGASATASFVETSNKTPALTSAFSVAVWFKAPAGETTGGGLWTFSTSQTGSGTGTDPVLWMDNGGNLNAGTYTGGNRQAITSGTNYANGAWHFAVVTVSAAGLAVYVDGSLAASNAAGTSGGAAPAYWQIGLASKASTWSDPPTNTAWTGYLAHFASFPSALSPGQISALYAQSSVGAYESQALAYSPVSYWPLTDTGTSESATNPFFQLMPDASGTNDNATAVGSTVTLGVPGPFGSSNAAAVNGGSGYLETANAVAGPNTFSLAAWFKAPNHATGGGIIGFANSQSGSDATGSSHDRTIWMDNAGKLVAGISGGSGVEASSPSTYDDGNWHFVVASFTPSTMVLYVDGSQVASVSSGISDANYTGYWTVGYAPTAGWADAPSTHEWTGSLAEVAVIPSALSSSAVTTLYNGGAGSEPSFETRVLADAPSQFWPLAASASAPTEAGGIEVSAQSTNHGSSSCLFPAGASSCPSLSESDFMSAGMNWVPAPPTTTYPTTVTLTAEEATAAPAPFSGLHFLVPLTYSGTTGTWTASLAYAMANLEL